MNGASEDESGFLHSLAARLSLSRSPRLCGFAGSVSLSVGVQPRPRGPAPDAPVDLRGPETRCRTGVGPRCAVSAEPVAVNTTGVGGLGSVGSRGFACEDREDNNDGLTKFDKRYTIFLQDLKGN